MCETFKHVYPLRSAEGYDLKLSENLRISNWTQEDTEKMYISSPEEKQTKKHRKLYKNIFCICL